jgi:hypothetical protein
MKKILSMTDIYRMAGCLTLVNGESSLLGSAGERNLGDVAPFGWGTMRYGGSPEAVCYGGIFSESRILRA